MFVQVFVSVLMLIFMSCGAFMMDSYSCDSKARKMGFESSYEPIEGCMIKVNGKWIPKEQYRVLGDVD